MSSQFPMCPSDEDDPFRRAQARCTVATASGDASTYSSIRCAQRRIVIASPATLPRLTRLSRAIASRSAALFSGNAIARLARTSRRSRRREPPRRLPQRRADRERRRGAAAA